MSKNLYRIMTGNEAEDQAGYPTLGYTEWLEQQLADKEVDRKLLIHFVEWNGFDNGEPSDEIVDEYITYLNQKQDE
jgi:hypothetical protein